MPRFRKIPLEIEAVRYGTEESGEWYSGAVSTVARFMLRLRPEHELTDHMTLQAVRPTGLWDPPSECSLEMWDGTAHEAWLPLALGDWVIKGVNGEFYPCKSDIMESSYERIDE